MKRTTLLLAALAWPALIAGLTQWRTAGRFRSACGRGLAEDRRLRHLERGLAGVHAQRGRREHLGEARRIPVRVSPHEGRLHRAGAGGIPGQGRGSASQGRHHGAHLDRRFRLGLRRRRVPWRRPHLAAVSQGARAKTRRRSRCRPPRARTSSSSNAAATCSSSRRRGSANPSRSRKTRTSDVPEEAYVGLFLSSHNPDVKETAIFRNVRVIRPVKVGFQPYRDYIGSAARDPERQERPSLADLLVARAVRGAELAARWLRAIYNASGNDAATRGRLWKFDLADAHALAHRHRLRHPQQQRPCAVVRRHAARHQRPEHRTRPVDHLHAADARRRAEAHHAAYA